MLFISHNLFPFCVAPSPATELQGVETSFLLEKRFSYSVFVFPCSRPSSLNLQLSPQTELLYPQSDYGGRGVGRDPLCICPQALAQVGSCPSKRVAAPCPTSNHAHEPRGHLHPARSSQASGEAARGLYHHGDLGGDARTAYTTTERCVLSPLPAGCPGVPLGYHGRAHEGQHGVRATSREAVLGVTGLTGRTRMNRPNLSGMDEGSKTETHPRLFRN